MKIPKDCMLIHVFILLAILATARSIVAEITMEAAFQGHCGHTSPCEQLCYEIHDGMYECDCIEGYELNKNGYSCQVINSSNSNDIRGKSDEDILYQKGASFSAKLAKNNIDRKHLNINYTTAEKLPLLTAHSTTATTSLSLSPSKSASATLPNESDEDDDTAYFNDDDLIISSTQQQKYMNVNDYYIPNENVNFNKNFANYHNYPLQQQPKEYKHNYNVGKVISTIANIATNTDGFFVNSISAIKRHHIAKYSEGRRNKSATIEFKHLYINNGDDDDNEQFSDETDVYRPSIAETKVYQDGNNNQINLRSFTHLPYQQQQHKRNNYQQLNRQQLKLQRKYISLATSAENHYPYEIKRLPTSGINGHRRYYQSGNSNNNRSDEDISKHIHEKSWLTHHKQVPTQHLMSAIINIIKNNNAKSTKKNLIMPLNLSKSARQTKKFCHFNCGSEGGVCNNNDGVLRCLCPFGNAGNNCSEKFQIRIPKFSQRSWLAFPALHGAYKHVQLRMEFRPESFDGIVLLSGERDDLTGDFMALLLNKGFIEFWFDCGSGEGSVRSGETVLLNEWNSVTVYRHRWDAWLILNQGNKIHGRSNGLFSRITFREPVFLGGIGNITGLWKRLPVTKGFSGCIRRFVVNSYDYRFERHPNGDILKGYDIEDCITDKCFRYPCQHGGKCLQSKQSARCLCPIGFVGDLCEIRLDLQVPSFNGSSFLRYAPFVDSALIHLELKVILKTDHLDGLVLYSCSKRNGDFVALNLVNGFVEFIYHFGSGEAIIRSTYPLIIGQWHTIEISRTNRIATLKIDQLPEVVTMSSNDFWNLFLPENLYIGGVDHIDQMPMHLKNKPFLEGCIQRIEVNSHSLAIMSEALGGSNIANCPHACIARPCGDLAECIPRMESYECRCNIHSQQCMENILMNSKKVLTNALVSKAEPLKKKIWSSEHLQNHDIKEPNKKFPDYSKRHWYQSKFNKNNPPAYVAVTSTHASVIKEEEFLQAEPLQYPINFTETNLEEASSVEDTSEFDDDLIFQQIKAMYEMCQSPFKPFSNKQLVLNYSQHLQETYSNYNKFRYHNFNPQQKDLPNRKIQFKLMKYHPSKLTRLPVHYESFQTDTDSDILTFDKSLIFKDDFQNSNKNNSKPIKRIIKNSIRDISNSTFLENFALTKTLFNDDSEDYQTKQLEQDMQRILANTNDPYIPKVPNAPKLIFSLGLDNDIESLEVKGNAEAFSTTAKTETKNNNSNNIFYNDLEENVSEDPNSNIDFNFNNFHAVTGSVDGVAKGTSAQMYTDWSLLSRFDLPANQHRQAIGVRKNFGACFLGHDSFYHYNDVATMSHIINSNTDLNLRIKVRSENGVILWTGQIYDNQPLINMNFLLLGIENGYLHFRYNLESVEVNIRFNSTKISDGLWHRIRAIRNSQVTYLEVDGRKGHTVSSSGKPMQLNTESGLYIGGMPNMSYLTRQHYRSGIVGCISEVIIAGVLKMNFDPHAMKSGIAHNVETGLL